MSEVNYNDDIYCVEVPLHNTLLVRRNGKVCWSGNCRSTTVPYFDDEDTEGERIARGEDNKQYNIPSKMTYDEWYNKYVLKKRDKTDIIEERKDILKTSLEYVSGAGVFFIPSGTEIEKVVTIAGYGCKVEFRNAEKNSLLYGGSAEKWKKRAGKIESLRYIFDIHWEENEFGLKVNEKIKNKNLKKE